MGVLKTIMSPSGKRKVGWIVRTNDHGVCLVVKRSIPKAVVTTRKAQYVSINESALQDEAGWSLDSHLLGWAKRMDVEQVVVYVPKPGIVYQTPLSSYTTPGVMYMASKSKEGDRQRTVGLKHFTRRPFKMKL